MPTPILFAGGSLTPDGQRLVDWLLANLPQMLANSEFIEEHIGIATRKALEDFAFQVVARQRRIPDFAKSNPAGLNNLWLILLLYAPEKANPAPAVPPQAIPTTESTRPTRLIESEEPMSVIERDLHAMRLEIDQLEAENATLEAEIASLQQRRATIGRNVWTEVAKHVRSADELAHIQRAIRERRPFTVKTVSGQTLLFEHVD